MLKYATNVSGTAWRTVGPHLNARLSGENDVLLIGASPGLVSYKNVGKDGAAHILELLIFLGCRIWLLPSS